MVIVSMFVPFHESSHYSDEIEVHKGFESYYAIFGCSLTLLWTVGIVFIPKDLSIPVLHLVFWGLSLILLGIRQLTSGMGDSDYHVMLLGFYLMLISQALMTFVSFKKLQLLRDNDKYMR